MELHIPHDSRKSEVLFTYTLNQMHTIVHLLSTFSDVLGIMEVTTKRIFLELLQRSMGNIFNLLEREMAYALTLSL